MIKTFIGVLLLFLLSGCVQLTPAGERVQVIREDQRALVSACKHLAMVSVSSADALRNTAAALSGDTAMLSHRDVGVTQYIKGDVYDCSQSSDPALQQMHKSAAEPTPRQVEDAEYLRKSRRCQSKGGAWIGGQCVISIE